MADETAIQKEITLHSLLTSKPLQQTSEDHELDSDDWDFAAQAQQEVMSPDETATSGVNSRESVADSNNNGGTKTPDLFTDAPHPRPIGQPYTGDSSLGTRNLRDRTNRRPIQDRTRQKRQTIQDMTRPLKHWLYNHRDNPYPSKSDKLQLARRSQMTMTQVSNWFANARRRLKNTVRGPDMTWGKRIKLYNNCVEGNQELLSVGSSSSDDDSRVGDTAIEQGEIAEQQTSPCSSLTQRLGPQPLDLSRPDSASRDLQDRLTGSSITHTSTGEPSQATTQQQQQQQQQQHLPTPHLQPHQDLTPNNPATTAPAGKLHPSPPPSTWEETDSPPKYKHSIMQRYLNDSYQSALATLDTPEGPRHDKERHRNPSGSLSSHDYEEYMSSASSSRSTPTRDHQDAHYDEYEAFSRHWPDIKDRAEEDLYWKEISAALALTSLARSRQAPVHTH